MAEEEPAVSQSISEDSLAHERAAKSAAEPAPSTVTQAAPPDATAAAEPPPSGQDADGAEPAADVDPAEIDKLLQQASFEDPRAAIGGGGAGAGGEAGGGAATAGEQLHLPNFQKVMREAQVSSIDLLRDVDLNVKIELGRARMLVEDVLKLSEGSVVELDKLAGDPVDVFVNERLVARGEVLVLNDNFCVRINEIVAGVKDEGL